MVDPYNPLDKVNLGKSVADALLESEAESLDTLEDFQGAGIYAIYYNGAHPAYDRLSKANGEAWTIPIYVGKAIPSGGRKGLAILSERIGGSYLHRRLQDHAESVRRAEDLNIEDFAARWLTVDDIWIPLGETLIIEKFQPVWNKVLDGFGNHDPGAGRYNGLRPMWDTLHPGRAWANKCRPRSETVVDLTMKVKAFLETIHMPQDPRLTIDDLKA